MWLPDPVLDNTGEHYKNYEELKGKDTTDDDHPSLKKVLEKPIRPPKRKPYANTTDDPNVEPAEEGVSTDGTEHATEFDDATDDDDDIYHGGASPYTAQNARLTVMCHECRKPRVIYSKRSLSESQKGTLVLAISDFEFTCGAPVLPPKSRLSKTVQVRAGLVCGVPVEVSYYNAALGQLDIYTAVCPRQRLTKT